MSYVSIFYIPIDLFARYRRSAILPQVPGPTKELSSQNARVGNKARLQYLFFAKEAQRMIPAHLQHKHLHALFPDVDKPVFGDARLLVEIVFYQPIIGEATG